MQKTSAWSWRTVKYLLIGAVGLVVLVVVAMLLINKRKAEADNLKRKLTIARADADIAYLEAKAKITTEKLGGVTEAREKLEAEIEELQKKREENALLIEGMTNEEVAAEFARRGF